MASVLLSASVERCFVSRMRDFFKTICWYYLEMCFLTMMQFKLSVRKEFFLM